MDIFQLFISAIFVNNIVLAQYLGNCPYLGCSKEKGVALGMGGAVIFVIIVATACTWLMQRYVLEPFGLGYLQTIVFIVVIASLVQFVEMFLKKMVPPLYAALGIFLPLIAVNCAIMGASLFMQQRIVKGESDPQYIGGIADAISYALGSGIGWMLAIVGLAAIREKMAYSNVPAPLRGLGITFIVVGLMAMAFMCFSGLKI